MSHESRSRRPFLAFIAALAFIAMPGIYAAGAPADAAHQEAQRRGLVPGTRVTATARDAGGAVRPGMKGTYWGTNGQDPPAFVIWDLPVDRAGAYYTLEGAPDGYEIDACWVKWDTIVRSDKYTGPSYDPQASPAVGGTSGSAASALSGSAANTGEDSYHREASSRGLAPGMRVTAVSDYDVIHRGMSGTYWGTNGLEPPAFVIWDDEVNSSATYYTDEGAPSGRESYAYWVDWNIIVPQDQYTGEEYAVPQDTSDDSGSYDGEEDSGDEHHQEARAHGFTPGMRVTAVRSYEGVISPGMTGTYWGTSPGDPPAYVIWDDEIGEDVSYYTDEGAPSGQEDHAYSVEWNVIDATGGYAEDYSGDEGYEDGYYDDGASDDGSYESGDTDSAHREAERRGLYPGMTVIAVTDYESVREGMTGTYWGTNGLQPPAFVIWDEDLDSGSFYYTEEGAPEGYESHAYWVEWDMIEPYGR
jgi:hypothetical protein